MNDASPSSTVKPSPTLSLTSAAMVLLAATFYLRSTTSVPSGAVRGVLGAWALAAALPYAWTLGLLLARRTVSGLLAALTCALAYVLGFGWIAVLLFLLSWGETTYWLPAVGLAVQLVALAVALRRWFRAPAAERAAASRGLAIGVPLLIVGVMLLLAQIERTRAERTPQVRRTQAESAERLAGELQRCLIEQSLREPQGVPARLEPTGPCAASARAAIDAPGMTLDYHAGAADAAGRRTVFMLCLRPDDVPDGGLSTVVADESGLLQRAEAPEASRQALPCAAAWGGGTNGTLRRLRTCLIEHAGRSERGYPATLDPSSGDLRTCLDATPRLEHRDARALQFAVGADGTATIRYVSAAADPRGSIMGYQLYAQCGAVDEPTIFDERGQLTATSPSAALRWLNDCAARSPPAGDDLPTLARRKGFRVVPASADSDVDEELGPGEATTEVVESDVGSAREPAGSAGAVGPSVTSEPDEEPRHGDEPDLAARRQDCATAARDCYGLGRELERAVRLAGGTPDRYSELSGDQQVLVREANESFDRACDAGRPRACSAAADIALRGRGVTQNPQRALQLWRRACLGGDAGGCTQLGELYESGYRPTRPARISIALVPGGNAQPITTQVPDDSRPGLARDPAQAIAWYGRACRIGATSDCARAARLTLETAAPTDRARQRWALGQFRWLCDRGQGHACEALARWARGHDGHVLGIAAPEWQRRACALGGAAGCDEGSP